MSTIRRQSVISSGVVYFGFVLGALNLYLFTRDFEPSQFGLTTLFVNMANIMFAFANFGAQVYIYKFYPYYKDNLRREENDMMTWALLISLVGFIVLIGIGVIAKKSILSYYQQNSPELVKYYDWLLPFGLGLTIYSLLEAWSMHLNRTVLNTFLREVLFRFFTTILILLLLIGLITRFSTFIRLYSLSYLLLAGILLFYLMWKKELFFPLTLSRVTRKFLPKIRTMALYSWGGSLVLYISTFFAGIIIAAVVPKGLEKAGIYSMAAYAGSIMQAPQRSLLSASVGPLSRAWKDKDMGRINRIYHRSSINQLIFAVAIYILILLNFKDGILTLHINPVFLSGYAAFIFIGGKLIIDMGTGLNAQIIGTSIYWRFELASGVLLLGLTLPLNYIMAKKYGLIGPAIADLVTFTIYNGIRCGFIYWKFKMQPFTIKTLYTLLLAAGGFFICRLLFGALQGFVWIAARSIVFIAIFGTGMIGLHLSEDVLPLWRTLLKRLGLKRPPGNN